MNSWLSPALTNPEQVTYASAGRGSGQHIAMAVTARLAGIKLTRVTYRGAQAAYQDVLGGRVDLFFDISSTARAKVDAGSVRALAVFLQGAPAHASGGAERRGDGRGGARYGKLVWPVGAGGRAAPTLARLRAELAKVLADPEVAALFAKTGGRLLTLSPPETEALITRDVQRWTKLIREAGISATPHEALKGGSVRSRPPHKRPMKAP